MKRDGAARKVTLLLHLVITMDTGGMPSGLSFDLLYELATLDSDQAAGWNEAEYWAGRWPDGASSAIRGNAQESAPAPDGIPAGHDPSYPR